MGPKLRKKDGCLFPFGNNSLTLFALMVLDEDRKRRSEEAEGEDDDLLKVENGEFDIDKEIDDED